MHTAMKQLATIEVGKPFGRTKPSLSELYMLEATTSTMQNIDTMLQVEVVIRKGLDLMIDSHVESFETK